MSDYAQEVLEQTNSWRQKANDVPFLAFPSDWQIRITPPFGRADARFSVRKGAANVSVYLDFDGNLGCMDRPYWEVHPIGGDCARYYLYETDELIAGIAESIRQQEQGGSDA